MCLYTMSHQTINENDFVSTRTTQTLKDFTNSKIRSMPTTAAWSQFITPNPLMRYQTKSPTSLYQHIGITLLSSTSLEKIIT